MGKGEREEGRLDGMEGGGGGGAVFCRKPKSYSLTCSEQLSKLNVICSNLSGCTCVH